MKMILWIWIHFHFNPLYTFIWMYDIFIPPNNKTAVNICIIFFEDIFSITTTVFCPRAGPSLQPMLQFCRRQVFHHKLGNHQGLNSCGSFQLLAPPHSLFSTWKDFKIPVSEKIPEAPKWRRGECIWQTGSSRLHRNSPQELNISSFRIFRLDQKSGKTNHPSLPKI